MSPLLCIAVPCLTVCTRRRKRPGNQTLSFLLNLPQMLCSAEALRIDFVDLLSAGRPGCEPTTLGDDLQSSNRRTVAWCSGEHCLDLLSSKFGILNLLGREPLQQCLLLGSGWRINPFVVRVTKLVSEIAVQLTRVMTSFRRHFRCEQSESDTVFVRSPNRPV